MSSGVYSISCKATDKYYISKTKDIELTGELHIKALKEGNRINKEMQEDFSKYGPDAFKVNVEFETDKLGIAMYAESYLVEYFKERNLSYNTNKLYNSGDIAYINHMFDSISKLYFDTLEAYSFVKKLGSWSGTVTIDTMRNILAPGGKNPRPLTKNQVKIFAKIFNDKYMGYSSINVLPTEEVIITYMLISKHSARMGG